MKQSITFDTQTDPASHVALAVAYAYGLDSIEDLLAAEDLDTAEGLGAEDPEEDQAAQVYPGGWSKPKMRRYVKALKPTAQKVLRAIAENSPKADVDDVQNASGVGGYTYAGSMSSFGFAARNTWGVKEKPFVKVGRSYEINPDVAKLAVAVLDELDV